MKPIKLTMQAFGPFLDKTAVDFSLFNDSIFLITGATGSGKTTMLDAIAFALYGDSSGGGREVNDLRCIGAPTAVCTEVELEFELFGNKYLFVRRITERLKRTGELQRDNQAECYNWENNKWQLAEQMVSRVDARAKELLGFEAKQFRQVILLPQGDFKRLLTAKSSDKEAILKSLFNTSKWQRVDELIGKREQEYKNEYNSINEAVKTLLAERECDNITDLEQGIVKTKTALKNAKSNADKLELDLKNQSNILNDLVKTDEVFKQLNRLQADYEKLLTQKVEVENKRRLLGLYQRAILLTPYYQNITRGEKDLAQRRLDLKAAEEALALAIEKNVQAQREALQIVILKKQREDSANRIALLKGYIAPAKQLKESLAEQNELEKKQASSIRLLKELTEGLERENKNKENYITQKEQLEQLKIQLPSLEQQQRTLQEHIEAINKVNKLKRAVDAAQIKYSSEIESYEASEKAFETVNSLLKQLRLAYLADQAYIMAQGLQDGEQCPVCGSAEHPRKAKPCKDAPEYAVITKKQLEYDLKQEEKNKCFNNAQESKLELENHQKLYNEAVAKLTELGSQDISELIYKQEQTAAKLEEYRLSLKAYNTVLEKIEGLKQACIKLEQDITTKKQQEEQITAKYLTAKSRCETLSSNLPENERDCDKLENDILSLEKILQEIDSKVVALEKAANEAVTIEEKAKTAKTAAESGYNMALNALEDFKGQYTKKLLEQGFTENVDITAFIKSEKQLNELKEEITQYDNRLFSTNEALKQATDAVKGVERPNMEEQNSLLDALKKLKTEADNAVGQAQRGYEDIMSTANIVKQKQESLIVAEKKHRLYSALYLKLHGNNAKKVNIHQFVLGLMLDEVTEAANLRLQTTSSGRYRLMRSDSPTGGRGTSGLELTVYDGFDGACRSIESLSGGECFCASLALALGLADVVQCYAGGISLETMFIDEGFGTLDPEVLDKAFSVLAQLNQAGRMVGIISHVEGLKEKLTSKIEVFKKQNGRSDILCKFS